jgi:formamidopyrimidine-DNA glycosylase
MPELPEVETTLRGIAPHLTGRRVEQVVIRVKKLRWVIPPELIDLLPGQTFRRIWRRGKYLCLETAVGTMVLHLGMTGHLRVVPAELLPGRHDHLDLVLDNGTVLRMTDPRRFGTVLWTVEDPLNHPLLKKLGPEPLDVGFDGAYLREKARGRSVAVKPFIMNGAVVVGVGNMYASEALFLARIDPSLSAGLLSPAQWDRIADAIRRTLTEALAAGEATLDDYTVAEGAQPYFRIDLRVYGREGEPCVVCGEPIRCIVLGQRSTYFCVKCQEVG